VHLEIPGLPQKVLLNPPTGDFIALEKVGGRFFSEILRLPAGSYAARIQIVFSEAATGENIRIAARLLSDRTELDSLELTATSENRTKLDDLILRFRLEEEQSVEIFGNTEANCTTTLIRYITVISQSHGEADIADFSFQGYTLPSVKDLTCVIFGTTAICNASCPHCPTNKVHRRDFPHGSMNFDMFTRIVTELRNEGYSGWFLFGLFGEPLEDPLLERRLRLIKELLPLATISIATNCGVYDPKKHACIVELADHIGVHVEAVSSEVYNRFMHPLKADRVFPKIISLLSIDQGKKVHITTPVHKGNLAEVANIRKYFEGYGAGEPHFTQIGNRSWEEGPWSQLALAPVGRWCAPDELRTFVVDWDGAVLACCLDFSKSAKLGDLTKQSIREVLNSKPWLEMFDVHRTKSWSQKEACSRCRGDLYGNTQTVVEPLLRVGNKAQHLSGHSFNAVSGVTRDATGGICVGEKTADGIVIYGPYRRFDPGRYRVRHFVEVIKVRAQKASIETDIVVDGVRRIAIKHHPISRHGGLELDMEFESEGSITEFRVAKVGVEFVHNGAIVQEISNAYPGLDTTR
jgi:radical SAM protein with 4Fe4S-binding SPASM domain